MTKIVPNDLLNPTEKTIKNWNCSFIAVEGPNVLDKLSLEDLEIPYESQYRSRIVLKAGELNQPLIYGFIGKAVTFLMVKVTYDSENDPYYRYEQEKYNIHYYFENDPILRPLGRLLIMTGSIENRIPQIYLNNPLDYDVVLDVLHATLDTNYEWDDALEIAEIDNALRSIYSQPDHNFAPGIAISNSGGTWIKADSSTDAKLGHIVIESIIDSDRFFGVQAGLITIPTWNLNPGAYYVVDNTGDGTLVEYNENINYEFSNPILQAINSTQGHVLPWRPSYQGDGVIVQTSLPFKLSGVNLSSSDWNLVGGYYQYTITNENITTKSIVTLNTYIESLNTFNTSLISPRIETLNGSAIIYAINQPSDDILVDIIITESL